MKVDSSVGAPRTTLFYPIPISQVIRANLVYADLKRRAFAYCAKYPKLRMNIDEEFAS